MPKRFNKSTLTLRIVSVGLFGALIAMLIGVAFIHKTRVAYQDEVLSDLSVSAKILATSFDAKSVEQQAALKKMAERPSISDSSVPLAQKLVELNTYADRHGLVRAGISTLSGNAYTSDNGNFSAVDREWFKKAKAGHSAVSASLYDRLGTGGNIIVFAEPIRSNNQVVGVLFAAQYTAEYLNTTQMQMLDRINRVMVFDKDGTLLTGAERGQSSYGFFSMVKNGTSPARFAHFRADLRKGYPGREELTFGGVEYETVYAPINEHAGWYVLMALNKSDLDQTTAHLITPLYVWLLIATIATFLFMVGVRLLYNTYLEMRKENKYLLDENDLLPSIPGIKSRSGLLHDIDVYYQKMDPDELALVGVIHIDSLKDYERIFEQKSMVLLRQALAQKVSFLSSKTCELAYASTDTYLVFATGFYSRKECRDYMLRVQAAMTESFDFQGYGVRLDSRAGAKIYFKNDDTARSGEGLLNCAEYALAQAQISEKQKICFYDYEMQVALTNANKLRRDLPGALKRAELCMVYQPEYNLASGALVGFEGLLRWRHPELGIILPDDFLPIAIEDGLIVEIGKWVVDQVFSDAVRLASDKTPVSYNASSIELLKKDYADYVEERFEHYGLKPHTIILELSDKNIAAVCEQAHETVERLKSLGIDIYLDNFGWWMAMASYLTRLPIDGVKVSQDYCVASALDKDCSKMLAGIVDVSHTWGVEVAAKGVLTEAQSAALGKIGFENAQGNYFSRPLTLDRACEMSNEERLGESDAES